MHGAALAVLLVSRIASASPEEDAQTLMQKGVRAALAEEYLEAIECYSRAASLVPSANLPHRYKGEALEKLQRWEEALASYQEYLRIKPGVRDADSIRQRMDEITRKRIEGSVLVSCTPSVSNVRVDGKDIGACPLTISLRAGKHSLLVVAEGFQNRSESVDVTAGTTTALAIKLVRNSNPIPSLSATAGEKRGSGGVLSSWWFWTGVGVVLAGSATALVLYSQDGSQPTVGGTFRY
jgi:tetratricopeptide (TPR) repeat protein